MRPYATVSPLFWTGSTGKRLRANPDAQRIAFYLMTSPHSHQSGMYYLPMMYLCHEVGIPQEGASKALQWLMEEQFCEYDETSEWIWVCEMAAWQIGTDLSAVDKRCKGVQQYLTSLPSLPFIGRFTVKYEKHYHLLTIPIRDSEGASSEQLGTEQEHEKERSTRETVAPAPSPLAKPRERKTGTKLSESFSPDQELQLFATSRLRDVDVGAMLEQFRAHHTASGTISKDWSASWRTWVMNAVAGFKYPKRGGVNGKAVADPYRGAM